MTLDLVHNLGNAALEGDDAGDARFTSRSRKSNYTQIFSVTVEVSGSELAVRQIGNTWHGPRSGGRQHQGQDIFAPRGTPVYSATNGIVIRQGDAGIGGNACAFVTVLQIILDLLDKILMTGPRHVIDVWLEPLGCLTVIGLEQHRST